MHAEIRKFWEERGRTIIEGEERSVSSAGSGTPAYYFVRDDGVRHYIASKFCGIPVYELDGEWYSEEQMLRIIKLIAFI